MFDLEQIKGAGFEEVLRQMPAAVVSPRLLRGRSFSLTEKHGDGQSKYWASVCRKS
jgi:hypothetical protein